MSAGTTVFEPTQPALHEPITNAQFSGIVPFFTASPEFAASLRTISRLAELPANWDSYGSAPIQRPAIEQAVKLLVFGQMFCPLVPDIVPVAGGGIQFEWQKENREVEIEVLPNGSMETLMVMGETMLEMKLPADRKFASVKMLLGWLDAENPYAAATR